MTEIVRRSGFAGGGITESERAAMAEHSKLWIARSMRTEPIEPDKITTAIKRLYAVAGLDEPIVVIVPSPIVMAFAYGFSAAIWHFRAATATAAATATDAATYAATAAATRAAARAVTDAVTEEATRVWTELAQYFSGNDSVFFLKCAERWINVYQGGNMWAPWDCYLTAARDVLGLRLKEHTAYSAWEAAAIHGGFRCLHEKFCIVSDFPEVLKVDDQARPHCEDGPSHRWRDGWSLYHWHGVRVPSGWIEDRRSLTPKIALSQENVELRRAACEILGWDNIIGQLDGRTIDIDPDEEIGVLVEVDLPDAGKSRFLRVLCATGRRFAIPVPNDMKTALAANCWTYDIPLELMKQKESRT